MASCITSQWSNSSTPQARLTVTLNTSKSDGDTAVLDWKLEYVAHGYAANTNGNGRDYSVTIDGVTVASDTYNIDGVKSTTTIETGSVNVAKGTSARNVSFGVSFAFKVTWSGTYGGTKSASGSISIPELTKYTVAYNANGGSGEPSSQTKYYGKSLTISSAVPTRNGYTFNNWALNKSEADAGRWYYTPGSTCGRNENLTLYAVWKANTYPVTYNANGGENEPAPQTKTYGITLTLSSATPTRTNYNFLGWAPSASATTPAYAAGANYTANTAVTLYAVWELAYVKPRITNVVVSRCDTDGTLNESGACASVKFDASCDRNISSVSVRCELTDGSLVYTKLFKPGASIQNGSFHYIVGEYEGEEVLSPETTYTIRITVKDELGESVALSTLPGYEFTIDFLAGGKGVAFGKPAEEEGLLDIAFQTHLRGGLKYVVLDNNMDLDWVLTPGFYVGSHLRTYTHCPVNTGSSFTLEVLSGGDIGQLIQRMTTCDMNRHVTHERAYYESYWGEWMKTSPTVIYEEMFYTPSAAETFELVGSITIPKRTAFTFTARGMWQNSRCHGVIISDRQVGDNGNHPYSYSVAACFNEDDRVFFPSCTYSGNTGADALTFYIWGKWQATNLNKVEVSGYYMPY